MLTPDTEENEIGDAKPRSLVTIQEVNDVLPIEGADAIECIQILGWYLVAKKDEFRKGDLAVFFEVDSILPDHPVFEFMRERKFRVKTAKFRKQISQGLALRIDEVLPHFGRHATATHNRIMGCDFYPNNKEVGHMVLGVGTDLTEAIGVTKYDPEGESLSGPSKKTLHPSFKHRFWVVSRYKEYRWKGMRLFYKSKVAKLLGLDDPFVVTPFPSNVPKTDETRVQNLSRHLQIHAGDICYVSEKCEGQSLTALRKGKKVNKCSRNIDMTKEKNSNWVKMAEKYNLDEILLSEDREYAIQAEIIGPGVQGNIYELAELEIRLFYVYDIKGKYKLNLRDFRAFCKKHNLPTVPILDDNFVLPAEIDTLVNMADGKSVINPKVLREGVVIVKRWDDYEGQPYSFKAISPKYELDKEAKLEKARKKAEKEVLDVANANEGVLENIDQWRIMKEMEAKIQARNSKMKADVFETVTPDMLTYDEKQKQIGELLTELHKSTEEYEA